MCLLHVLRVNHRAEDSSEREEEVIPTKLLKMFINNLDAGLEGILIGNTKLGGAVSSLEGRGALQRDLDKLEMGHHQLPEVQQGQVVDSAPETEQPWLCVWTGA